MVVRGHSSKEHIRTALGTKATVARGVGKLNIAPSYVSHVAFHIFAAVLAFGRLEVKILVIRTLDIGIRKASGEHRRRKICEGGYTIHEDPEAWEAGWSSKYTLPNISRRSIG